jgi:type VI protein secretion system component VasK
MEEAVLDPGLDRIIRFELLKAYLMLAGEAPVPMDRALIESAIGLVLVERTETERAVAFEAGRLMAAAAERGVSRARVNPAVLEQARLLLGNDRDRLTAEIVLDRLREDFNTSEAGGPAEFSVPESAFFACTARFASDAFYTAPGIAFVERSLPNLSDAFSTDLWVLGVSAGEPGGAAAVVIELARKTYTEQYLQRWRTDLASCQAKPVSRADLPAFAAELGGGRLPMTALLRQLRPHLAPADVTTTDSTVSLRDVEQRASDGARRLLERAGAATDPGAAAAPSRSLAARLREGFGDLATFLDGGGAVSIGTLEALLGAVATDLQDERVAGAAGLGVREMQQAGIGSVNALRDVMRNATQYPEPIAGWIRRLFDSARAAQVESVAQGIAAAQQERLRKDCPRALLQMYPFRKSAVDEAPPLMVQEALGPQGYFESTLTRELDGEVTFGPGAWKFRGELKTVAGIPESALESFRLARFTANRLGFSSGSGGFPLGIAARGFGNGLAQVTIQLGPETVSAVRPGDSSLINWSPQTGGQMVFSFIGIDGVTSEVRLAGAWSLLRAVDRFLERPSDAGVLLKVDSGQHWASIELSSLQLRELVTQPGWRGLGCPV